MNNLRQDIENAINNNYEVVVIWGVRGQGMSSYALFLASSLTQKSREQK